MYIVFTYILGGRSTSDIVVNDAVLREAIRGIAGTDTFFSKGGMNDDIKDDDQSSIDNLFENRVINWVTIREPLDTVLHNKRGIWETRSAGHIKHEYTSHSAMNAIFKWFDYMMKNPGLKIIDDLIDVFTDNKHDLNCILTKIYNNKYKDKIVNIKSKFITDPLGKDGIKYCGNSYINDYNGNIKWFQCSKCKVMKYCSREHQRKNWKYHKYGCFVYNDNNVIQSKQLIKDKYLMSKIMKDFKECIDHKRFSVNIVNYLERINRQLNEYIGQPFDVLFKNKLYSDCYDFGIIKISDGLTEISKIIEKEYSDSDIIKLWSIPGFNQYMLNVPLLCQESINGIKGGNNEINYKNLDLCEMSNFTLNVLLITIHNGKTFRVKLPMFEMVCIRLFELIQSKHFINDCFQLMDKLLNVLIKLMPLIKDDELELKTIQYGDIICGMSLMETYNNIQTTGKYYNFIDIKNAFNFIEVILNDISRNDIITVYSLQNMHYIFYELCIMNTSLKNRNNEDKILIKRINLFRNALSECVYGNIIPTSLSFQIKKSNIFIEKILALKILSNNIWKTFDKEMCCFYVYYYWYFMRYDTETLYNIYNKYIKDNNGNKRTLIEIAKIYFDNNICNDNNSSKNKIILETCKHYV